jgi:hypothetical protein
MPSKTFSVNFETSGFRRTSRKMKQVGDEANDSGDKLQTAGQVGAAAVGAISAAVTGAVAGMGALVAKTAEYAKQVDNAAEQSGVGAERIQEIAFAAERVSGVQFDTVRDGLKELALRSAEAAEGTGEAQEAFKRLGISQQFLQNATTSEIFSRVQKEMKGLTKQQRILTTEQVFGGEAGEKFAEVMGLSADEMNRLAKQARASGKVLSSTQVAALERARASWQSLTSEVVGFGRQLAARFAPAVRQEVIPALRSMFSTVRSAINVLTSMSDTTKGTIVLITGLTAAVSAGLAIWGSWPAIVAGVSAAFSGLATAATTAWAAVTSPITGVIAAVAAVAATAGLVVDNWSGLVDFFRQMFNSIRQLARAFDAALIQGFITAWMEVKAVFLDAIDGLIGIVNDGLQALGAEDMTIGAEFGMSQQALQEQRSRLGTAVSDFQSAGADAATTFTSEIDDGWSAVKKSTTDAVGFVQDQIAGLGSLFSFDSGAPSAGTGGTGGGEGNGQATPGQQGQGQGGGALSYWMGQIRKMRKESKKTKKSFMNMTNTLSRGMNRSAGTFSNFIGQVAVGKNTIQNFGQVAKQVLRSLIQQIITATVKSAILKGIFTIFSGGAGAAIPAPGPSAGGGIPFAADGGIVTGPTLLVAGEGGESEAIVPLSKLSKMMGGGGPGGGGGTVRSTGPAQLAQGEIKIPVEVVDTAQREGQRRSSRTGRTR